MIATIRERKSTLVWLTGPADATKREFCFRTHLELRSARKDATADYVRCLAE